MFMFAVMASSPNNGDFLSTGISVRIESGKMSSQRGDDVLLNFSNHSCDTSLMTHFATLWRVPPSPLPQALFVRSSTFLTSSSAMAAFFTLMSMGAGPSSRPLIGGFGTHTNCMKKLRFLSLNSFVKGQNQNYAEQRKS